MSRLINSALYPRPKRTMVLESAACPLCGQEECEPVVDKGQHNLPASVVVCLSCGLGYLSPRLSPADYLHFYRTEYDSFYRPELTTKTEPLANAGDRTVAIVERLKEAELLKNEPSGVLEIGSGEGVNLLSVRAAVGGNNYCAIEPSPAAQQVLTAAGVRILAGDVQSRFEDFGERFDLVIMRHVLEHFHNPVEILRKARQVMRENAVLYVAVPNTAVPKPPLLRNHFRIVHISYFNPPTLRLALLGGGFNIELLSEGEGQARHELFAIATPGGNFREPTKVPGNARRQLAVYSQLMKAENRVLARAKRAARQLRSRTLPLFKR